METKNIYAYNPEETVQASVFSKLMRNVYRWMTFALAITGLTAACVAGNATLMQFIYAVRKDFSWVVSLTLAIRDVYVLYFVQLRIAKVNLLPSELLGSIYELHQCGIACHACGCQSGNGQSECHPPIDIAHEFGKHGSLYRLFRVISIYVFSFHYVVVVESRVIY